MIDQEQIIQRARLVRGIIFDVDGVLTDGRIVYTDDGRELKQFHVQDGASIKLLQSAGIQVAIITGRTSPMVERRAAELGIVYTIQGAASKADAIDQLIDNGFPSQHNAAVGDDLPDLAVFAHASIGLAITVPNAHPAVVPKADWVTNRAGGEGVVVEIAELMLRAQNKWSFSE